MAEITEIHGYVEGKEYNVEFKVGGEVFFLRNIQRDAVPGLGQNFANDRYNPHMYTLESGERSYRVLLRSRLTDFVLLEEIIEKDDE